MIVDCGFQPLHRSKVDHANLDGDQEGSEQGSINSRLKCLEINQPLKGPPSSAAMLPNSQLFRVHFGVPVLSLNTEIIVILVESDWTSVGFTDTDGSSLKAMKDCSGEFTRSDIKMYK